MESILLFPISGKLLEFNLRVLTHICNNLKRSLEDYSVRNKRPLVWILRYLLRNFELSIHMDILEESYKQIVVEILMSFLKTSKLEEIRMDDHPAEYSEMIDAMLHQEDSN